MKKFFSRACRILLATRIVESACRVPTGKTFYTNGEYSNSAAKKMSQMTVNRDAFCAVLVWSACVMLASAWAPVDAPLRTRWSADVHPDQSPAYPRPELVREKWGHLNGLWQIDYNVTDLSDPPFGRNLTEEILVPYPLESPLSGIRRSPARGSRPSARSSLSSEASPLRSRLRSRSWTSWAPRAGATPRRATA